VYHLLDPQGTPRMVLQVLDHAAIFMLIACSFTPIHAILFRGVGRWGMLALIWTFGIVAISLKTVFFASMPQALGLSLYLGMGWIGLGSGIALLRRFPFPLIEPILWGGVAYSIGAVLEFLRWPVLIPGVVQWHEVFHLAVLIGLAFHWSFVYAIADGRLAPRPVAADNAARRGQMAPVEQLANAQRDAL
jgi:channel protein (hemolysin III family)